MQITILLLMLLLDNIKVLINQNAQIVGLNIISPTFVYTILPEEDGIDEISTDIEV